MSSSFLQVWWLTHALTWTAFHSRLDRERVIAHHFMWKYFGNHMMTSSNGNIFRVTGHLSPVPGEFPAQRPVTRSFDVFFDLRLNKRSSKQSWGWWFETLPRPLWRHSNDTVNSILVELISWNKIGLNMRKSTRSLLIYTCLSLN